MTRDFVERKNTEGIVPLEYNKQMIYVTIDSPPEIKKEAFRRLIYKSLRESHQLEKEIGRKRRLGYVA